MSHFLICDPICAQGFGHNLSALHYFSNFFKKRLPTSKIINIVSKYLPKSLDDTQGLELHRLFHHYYQTTMPLENYSKDQETLTFKEIVSSYNTLENLAYCDQLEIFNMFSLGKEDSIFFPSADFYSCQAILRYYEKNKPENLPKLFLRFIGVMENNTKYYTEPRGELFSLIKHLNEKKYPLFLSAETPKYADFIAERVDTNVSCLTYPVMAEALGFQRDKESFKVLCPGAQRSDKGFERLYSILSRFILANPEVNIEVYLQCIQGKNYRNYQSQLYALPGMNLLPSSISMEEMKDLYKKARVVLLPYNSDIYYLRGSAVLMEAISYGRPVITSSHTALSEQVRYYQCGKICENDEEFSLGLKDFYDLSDHKIERQAMQSRFRYEQDCDFAYRSHFQC